MIRSRDIRAGVVVIGIIVVVLNVSAALTGLETNDGGANSFTFSTSPSVDTIYKGSFAHMSKLLFIHVGKTGGETVKQVLETGCSALGYKQKRDACFRQLPKSRLSDKVKYYAHYEKFSQSKVEISDGFLTTIRNPMDRALSWYKYMHPTSCQKRHSWSPSCLIQENNMDKKEGWAYNFFTCFPTAQSWADALETRSSNADKSCSEMAWETLQGRVKPSESAAGHMTRNLTWYAFKTMFKTRINFIKPVFVARTEFLWDDLVRIDQYLGGTGNFGDRMGTTKTHGSEKFRQQPINAKGRVNLCCSLKTEFDTYRMVLFSAVNLSEQEKEGSWNQALKGCGFESADWFATACSGLSSLPR